MCAFLVYLPTQSFRELADGGSRARRIFRADTTKGRANPPRAVESRVPKIPPGAVEHHGHQATQNLDDRPVAIPAQDCLVGPPHRRMSPVSHDRPYKDWSPRRKAVSPVPMGNPPTDPPDVQSLNHVGKRAMDMQDKSGPPYIEDPSSARSISPISRRPGAKSQCA